MAMRESMFPRGFDRGRSRRDFLRMGLGASALALGAPLLAACGTEVDAEAAKRRELIGPAPALRDVAAPRQPRAGVLRLGATPATLPAMLAPLISAQLCAVDPRTGVVYGDLAERVELAGDLDVVFTLREDARFHPNAAGLAAALTSEDVRRDFAARAADPARNFLFAEVVSAVEAPEARTVVLRLKAPFATLFESLADPAQGAIRGVGSYAVLEKLVPAMGEDVALRLSAGPFIPGDARDDSVLLGANQLYHRPSLPMLEAVSIAVRPDHASLEALATSGEVDLHRFAGSASPDETRWRTATRPSRGLLAVALSAAAVRGVRSEQATPFHDERVRRAVSIAIDRWDLPRGDAAVISGPVGPAFGPDALEADELEGHALFRYNPEAAKGLLEAAGQAGLAFTMLAPDNAEARALLPVLQSQLRERAGMRMRPALVPTREWEAAVRTGDFEAAMFETPDLRTPDAGLRLHTSGGPTGTFSPWGYSNPVYDAAVRTALSALAPAQRAERSRAAQRTLLDSVPALLPLRAPIEAAWVSTSLLGYEWDAHGFNEGWLAASWRFPPPRVR